MKFLVTLIITSVLLQGCFSQYFNRVQHPFKPRNIKTTTGPLPTNSWFQNLLLGDGRLSVQPMPYTVVATTGGLVVCYAEPFQIPRAVINVFHSNWIVKAKESTASHLITEHDDLTVTLEWGTHVKVPLALGSPYMTFFFTDATLVLTTIHAITRVNRGSTPTRVSGKKFNIALNNGQTWIFYFDKAVNLIWEGSKITMMGKGTFVFRMATINRVSEEAILDKYASGIPISGRVKLSSSGDIGKINYSWETYKNQPELLMLSLVHHRQTIKNSVTADISYYSIKGDMNGVVGKSWDLEEPLTKITWGATKPIQSDKVDSIRASLGQEVFVTKYPQNPYFFGKALSRLARLALIADELNENRHAARFRAEIKTQLIPYIRQTANNTLLYDTVWGGIVSTAGVADPQADFGQGYYNDHQFHYGYWVYAMAVVGLKDPQWLQANKQFAMEINNDYLANVNDPLFRAYRGKDWYSFHSWANGLFSFGDNRNQESTSESINGYYASYLLGVALKDAKLIELGRIMLATEVRGTNEYWHMTSNRFIYPLPFREHKTVGILWGTKVDYATWFGVNPEYIHCIQMMPFTPISEEYMEYNWAKEQWPILEAAAPAAAEGWRGLIFMNQAVFDKKSAWDNVLKLTEWDDGNSKTNTLYWIATR